jgi:hypothetical protein
VCLVLSQSKVLSREQEDREGESFRCFFAGRKEKEVECTLDQQQARELGAKFCGSLGFSV